MEAESGGDPAAPAILVLGAAGRIGGVLRRDWPTLLPAGADLRWQARRRPADYAAGEAWHILAPLEDPATLVRAAEGVDTILCLAGVTPGHGGELDDNARLAEASIRAAQASTRVSDRKTRVLLASSAAVYGNQPGTLPEEAPLHPATPYGAAKAEMEAQALRLGAEAGVAVTALRIGNIAGLDAILGGWRPGFQLDRFADGTTPRRSYIGVRMLAQVLAALVQHRGLPEVVNVAQPGPVAMGDLLRAAGLDFSLRPAPDGAIPEVALEVTRLAGLLPPDVPLPPADPARLVAEWAALRDES
ncbi:NAD(P)-dependent oxidoreductase [Phaeobacter gallaeciensis]|uniref:NAD-dependent epimerase/dehydratase family protein n=1 Tax=Phaeobacter gallaeciensis TaxID=60890 RepID=UPI00237F2102|nr:NAD(P)-dependent oxidoreductase [Phaeobacter gallaeciensis]MDE4306277.1 NAD(P)-dependent oxidoreductase [Phaeobacter gallaeciensis]MDE4310743.1 NAD(P)-dependent oxidoreductase [Phaeobacter gallaeciensis]MDE4315164.1 NAD(P)-dependent oxidoreductase [Phaeobacter gallaeciensis]MDE4319651.1 NAD(P)-dependent oxidoreductase [Phaeobacter gallaeciensis]MDE4324079.1 NAD(P)-dependent oxidoreductase [Phaeobacter gallaeciensis]